MDRPNRYLELIHDGLYARNMKYSGCFAFNQSSDRVQEVGVPIMPALEDVLRVEVMAYSPSDPAARLQKFPGMGNLLVDYFHIAKNGQMDRAAEFLSSLQGPLLIEAIRAVSIVWDHAIPVALMTTLETVARIGSPEERAIASWLLDWHHNKPQIVEELAASRKEVGP